MLPIISSLGLKMYDIFAGAPCAPAAGKSFFGLPPWYTYLAGETDNLSGKCIPQIKTFNDFWAIGLAVVDILLRVGGFIAVIYVIYGGFLYMTSQGEPDRTAHAKDSILNAIIGVIIVIIAIVAVNFIGATIR